MPAIPYIQPIPKWITDELDLRAGDQTRTTRLRPFVMLTSPAVVTTTQHSSEMILSEEYNAKYSGCVLSNTTDVSKLYQTGNSIIGYDLNGKPIEVTGESNRKLSVPLIIDLQIEDGGENSVLKTAKLNIKVFSLKQLEMFEMFFLRPGMQLLLEYGNNSDLISKDNKIANVLFPKREWKEFVNNFTKVYSPLDADWQQNKKDYIKKLKDTGGNYDVWTGKVQGYSFSIAEDGTYNVNLEISAGNELASQLLSQTPKAEGKKAAKIVRGDYKSYIAKLAEDINPDLAETFKNADAWKKEFFNWGIENKKSEDNTISKTPYISFRLILQIINALNISENIITGKAVIGIKPSRIEVDAIPVSATKYFMSSNENVIFPGILPDIIADENEGKIKVNYKAEGITNKKTKKKTFVVSTGKECKINGYSFLLDESGANTTFIIPTDDTEIPLPPYTGNLLNVFINYDTFVSARKNAIQNSDLLFEMLNLIQMNMYGYSYLELATPDSSGLNTGLTIIDRKLSKVYPEVKTEPPYKFTIGPQNTILQSFSFDFQMDDLMAGQTLYSTKLEISEAEEKLSSQQPDNVRYPLTLATSANMEYFKNADGLYAINPIEIRVQKQLHKKKKEEEAAAAKTATPKTAKELEKEKLDKAKEQADKVKQAKESVSKNYVRFRFNPNDVNTHNMIYTDEALLKYYLVKEPNPDTVLVSGVDVTIAIDGMSGFSTGDYFLIEGVPEVYNQNGCFQITSIQQGINENGWLTTITAGWLRKQI